MLECSEIFLKFRELSPGANSFSPEKILPCNSVLGREAIANSFEKYPVRREHLQPQNRPAVASSFANRWRIKTGPTASSDTRFWGEILC